MTAQQLHARPSLDQLKRQAKDLLRSGTAGDPDALARFRTLPAFAGAPDAQFAHHPPALHDAQSVIARELGFDSWNALRERVEELTLAFDDAVTQFIEACTDERTDRATRLLAMHPGIAGANLVTEILTGDAAGVKTRLEKDPALAARSLGPRDWPPMVYLCHNVPRPDSHARRDAAAAIARQLIALGVDPNMRVPWIHHGVRRPILWGAVCVSRSLPLARALLEAGADPSDGVTLPIAASGGDVAALELLLEFGVDVNRPWASDGASPVYAMMQWSRTPVGIYWLLDHGADANAVFAQNGETLMHAAARGWNVEMVERLAARGADVTRPRADGRSPYAVARLNGNADVADWLLTHGASDDVSPVDRLVAACSRGDRATAESMLASHPGLRGEIAPEHYPVLIQAAERGDSAALAALALCGFDLTRGDDEIGKTPLHAAAMEGWVDAVRVLLEHGASVSVRDREFHGQPLVWAAEGMRMHGANGRDGRGDDPRRDHATVGQLLLAAGSPQDWEAGQEPAEGLADILNEWRRKFASAAG